MEIKSRYTKRVHKGFKCDDRSRTKQADKDACDINNIIARYKKTGILPEQRQGFYADVSNVKDYRESLHQVIAAEDAFMRLPAKLRDRFANNPAAVLDFIADPKNIKECEDLGLIEKKIVEKPNEDVSTKVDPVKTLEK